MALFSVVLCTYNRAERVGTAIEAVLNQTFEDFELIVVNDGSTDHTTSVIASYDDSRLRGLDRPNGGLSAARNTGIDATTGRLVAFLDDDDEVSDQWLEGLAKGVDRKTGFTACTCRFVDPERQTSTEVAARTHVLYPDVRGVFMAGTFAVDRDVLLAVGGYSERIRVSHQSELLLRVLPEIEHRVMTTALINEPLIAIERRQADKRPFRQPADVLQGAEYLIERHGEALATRPHALANYYAIAGVNAAKIGDSRRSRRHLCKAATTHPRNIRHVFRFALSIVPPVARWKWNEAHLN